GFADGGDVGLVPRFGPPQGPGARYERIVTAREGAEVDVGVVQLEATGTISGRVLGPSGVPAKGGYIMEDKPGIGYQLDTEGRFSIDGLAPGVHTLRAEIHFDDAG